MALAEVQHIIEIMKSAASKNLEQQRIQLEGQRTESEAQDRLARQDQAAKELQRQEKEFQMNHDLAVKSSEALMTAHKIANSQALQQMGQTYQQTGVAPGGASMSPAISTQANGQANASPTNPAQATSQMMSIPGVDGSIQVASPEAAASAQAARAEIAAAPGRKTEELKQGLETTRQVALTQATQEAETKRQAIINAQNQASALKLRQMDIAGENYRNSVSTGTQLKIAMLPYSVFNNMDPQSRNNIVQPSVDALNDGTMSAKQVQQQFNEKGMMGAGTAVISSFMGAGGVPPTDKQVQFLQQVKPIIDNLTPIAQYIQALPKTSGSLESHVAGFMNSTLLNPDLEAKYKQIEFQIATVAKTLGGDAGQRLQKALLAPAEGGYLPNKFQPTTANVSNYNKLVDVVHKAIDSELGSIPVAQRANIKNKLGLTSVGLLNPDGSPLNASPQQQAPQQVAAPATGGGVVHWIRVNGKLQQVGASQ